MSRDKSNKIRAKVHRLPTEQAEKCVTIAHKQMFLSPGLVSSGGDIQAYHLYITTDEEIKEGDWFVSDGEVFSWRKGFMVDSPPEVARKIIATTNTELHYNKVVEKDMHMYKKSLSQPTQTFIEEYCKQGGIDEVDVEYYGDWWSDVRRGEIPVHGKTGPKPIIDPTDNTITTHLIEGKMYSRDEVISFAKYAIKNGFGLNHTDSLFDRWIKKNL